MAVSTILGTDVVWGTSGVTAGTGVSTIGKILSFDSKLVTKTSEQADENDELYSMIYYDPREEITLEILAKPATTKPVPGGTIVVNTLTYYVKDSSEKWASNAAKKYSVAAWRKITA